jgi:hypothetical protein
MRETQQMGVFQQPVSAPIKKRIREVKRIDHEKHCDREGVGQISEPL